MCPIITNPSWRPAWSSEVASAPLLAGESHHVFLWRRQQVVSSTDGVTGQTMQRQHITALLSRKHRPTNSVRNVIMTARRVINQVASAPRYLALQRNQLPLKAIVVEQRHGATVQRRHDRLINFTLCAFAHLVRNTAVLERLAHPFTSPPVACD